MLRFPATSAPLFMAPGHAAAAQAPEKVLTTDSRESMNTPSLRVVDYGMPRELAKE
jgi:hypothetical protein